MKELLQSFKNFVYRRNMGKSQLHSRKCYTDMSFKHALGVKPPTFFYIVRMQLLGKTLEGNEKKKRYTLLIKCREFKRIQDRLRGHLTLLSEENLSRRKREKHTTEGCLRVYRYKE